MIRQLKVDFCYAWYSKLFIGMLSFFILTTLLTFFMSDQNVRYEYNSYIHQLEYYQQTGADIEEALNTEYEIIEDNGNSGTIKNPLSFHYEELSASLYSITSDYAFSQLCEGGLVFFPILASFFGLIWATADIKHKTLRYRVMRLGKYANLWSRQINGFIILLSFFILTIPFAFVIQSSFRNQFLTEIDIDVSTYIYASKIAVNYAKQLLFVIAILLFYYEFGYTFGNLLKGNPVSIIVLCIYLLFIPPFFSYDIANIFNNFANTIFEFVGSFSLTTVLDVPLISGALVLFGIFFAMLLCNIMITKKRSSYI
ncbi:MAG: hypothetical protein IJO29_08445 [Oscillospiraceae bacterium]|nr:hypothetical protein [Oscillospiraceae bacterium]